MKLLAVLLAFFVSAAGLRAEATVEIEGLLAYVKSLENAVLIRNGSTHTPTEAAEHFRTKWEKQKAKVTTAEEFITLCAAKSTVSGEKYRIKFADGTERFTEDVLLDELKTMRARVRPSPSP